MKLLGYAKTVATDRCAGTQAIGLAAEELYAGRAKCFLAGAAEAPLTPFVEIAAARGEQSIGPLREGAAYLLLRRSAGQAPAIAAILAHATATIGTNPLDRAAYCECLLRNMRSRYSARYPYLDVLIDGASAEDRLVLEAFTTQSWVRRSWWVGDLVGDSLAATGPIAAAAVCARYSGTDDRSCTILISLGSDFVSTIVFSGMVHH
jgi:hypothetical protein